MLLSTLDYHVLLALAAGPLHGYALKDAVARESDGLLTPRPGSLYRVIARLISAGFLREVDPGDDAPAHPGVPRRYYALTLPGRRALHAESVRLAQAAAMARKRLGLARER